MALVPNASHSACQNHSPKRWRPQPTIHAIPCQQHRKRCRRSQWLLICYVSAVSGPEKPINKQAHKQSLHRTVPGLSQDCPGIFLRFPGICFLCFRFRPRKGQHVNRFDPHPFPGQSQEVVFWFLLYPNCRGQQLQAYLMKVVQQVPCSGIPLFVFQGPLQSSSCNLSVLVEVTLSSISCKTRIFKKLPLQEEVASQVIPFSVQHLCSEASSSWIAIH